jgi:glycosyltransferase involved in cell wall biosynthesis
MRQPIASRRIEVALLTGGADKPYAFGLATALMSNDIDFDLIAGDELNSREFQGAPNVNFLNLRGNQAPDASPLSKVARILTYYGRLVRYALIAKPKIFHILWNNKFETIDRTLLTLYYKLVGKRVVLTVHNVNVGQRDATDTVVNRLTLRIQYHLADHIFVHTEKMKDQLTSTWSVPESAITVIPFGINNAVPDTAVTPVEAKRRFGIGPHERTILFFGTIAPYKGIEYLVGAFERLVTERCDYRLLIAGKPRKGSEEYWDCVHRKIHEIDEGRIIQKIEFISDADTELYFKAADVLILPYTEIFQSGVLFLGYSFGLPVIAADVGSLSDDIVSGETGLVCRPRDAGDLARTIDLYFASELFRNLPSRRRQIRDYAVKRHSWDTVSEKTKSVYAALLASEFTADERADAARKQPAL